MWNGTFRLRALLNLRLDFEPFNFSGSRIMLLYTDLVRQIVEDMALHVPDFVHLDPARIGVVATARASGHPTGNLATCYGLNRDNQPTFSIWTRPRSRQIIAVSHWFQYRAPRVRLTGRDMSYMILLRLPRLLLRNPLPILVHELYHISEKFDQKMRPVRHGSHFNREVRRLTQAWLARRQGELARLAQLRLHELEREFGAVLAMGVPSHFTIPLVEEVDLPTPDVHSVRGLYPGYTLAPRYEIHPVPASPEDAIRVVTEKDLVLRHYSRNGSERIPATMARYSQRNFPLST